jgi:hypothetical protein
MASTALLDRARLLCSHPDRAVIPENIVRLVASVDSVSAVAQQPHQPAKRC